MDEKMKTGVEIIADRRAAIASVSRAQMESVFSIVVRAEMMIEFGRHEAAVDLLAEAGSFIAAEIDRINKLPTK